MAHLAFKRIVVFDLSEVPTSKSRADLVQAIRTKFEPAVIKSIQFVPVKQVQVTFEDPSMKGCVERFDDVLISEVPCKVLHAGPRAQNVMVYHYPYDADDQQLKVYLSTYGKIENVRYQHYPGSPNISTGTHSVRIVRRCRIPRNMEISGYEVKVWYVGQPPECDICHGEHVSKDCHLRGKCRRCLHPGHMARECTNPPMAWGAASRPPQVPPQ